MSIFSLRGSAQRVQDTSLTLKPVSQAMQMGFALPCSCWQSTQLPGNSHLMHLINCCFKIVPCLEEAKFSRKPVCKEARSISLGVLKVCPRKAAGLPNTGRFAGNSSTPSYSPSVPGLGRDKDGL